MKKLVISLIFWISFPVFAYTPTVDFVASAESLGRQMVTLFARMPDDQRGTIIQTLDTRLMQLQNDLIGRVDTKSLNRLYLIQYLARHLPGLESFEEPSAIYDELASVIWTRAQNGFDVVYQPFNTPRFEAHDTAKKYRALVNGGYFNKIDGSIYHAGLLALGGERYTPPVFDNTQVTHFLCQDSH